MQFAQRQRRSRSAATTADKATARASNGARSIAIYTKAARSRRPAATTADNTAATPFDGARLDSAAADQRRQQPTTQPPEPLTERDLWQFTLRQRRLWPFPLRQRRRLCVVSVCVLSFCCVVGVCCRCVLSLCVWCFGVCVVSVCVVSVCVVFIYVVNAAEAEECRLCMCCLGGCDLCVF